MMTEAYYEMERAFLYRELCYTQSFQREFLIRKKIEKLEKEWAEQNKNNEITFELDKPKKRRGKKK